MMLEIQAQNQQGVCTRHQSISEALEALGSDGGIVYVPTNVWVLERACVIPANVTVHLDPGVTWDGSISFDPCSSILEQYQ